MKKAVILSSLIILTCVGGVIIYNLSVAFSGQPMAAVYAEAERLDWDEQDLALQGAGYSTQWLSWSAYGKFRSESNPEYGEIIIKVRKPSPLHGWQLDEYTHAKLTPD